MRRQIRNRGIRFARGATGPYANRLSARKYARAAVSGSIHLWGTEILGFEDSADWTLFDGTSGGNSAKANSTLSKTGDAASVKFTTDVDTGGSGTAQLYQFSAFDLNMSTDRNIAFWVYAEDQDRAETNRWQSRITASTSGFGSYMRLNDSSIMAYPGWNFIEFHSSEWTSVGGEQWSDSMRSLGFAIVGRPSRQQIYHIDQMLVGHKARKPYVIFSFDDTRDSQYDIAWKDPTHGAEVKGVPLTLYAIPSLLGGASYMSNAELTEMYDAGCSVCMHDVDTWDNKGAPSGLTTYINNLRTQFSQWPRDLDHASYPQGAYGQDTGADNPFDVFDGMEAAGVNVCRSVVKHVQPVGPYGIPHQLNVHGISLDDTLSLAEAKEFIDKAILRGHTCIFYGHQLGATQTADQWVTSDWGELLDYAIEKQTTGDIEITTVPAWYKAVGK